ncbi:hypothetical protein QCA50_000181 [Cerrena zonata]|uniref:Ribosomal RNA-processing protein 8 n=1 Tax=Cerrena zonata TaxID=2478898 RepID=A0AAW0GZF7_9APHY
MALFQVPGWSVPSAAPMVSAGSNKRKRPSGDKADADKISSAAVNVEQLIAKFGSGDGVADTPKKKQRTRAKGQEPKGVVPKREPQTSKQKGKGPRKPVQEQSADASEPAPPLPSPSSKSKGKQSKPKDKRKDSETPSKAKAQANTDVGVETQSNLTSLQSKMKNSLEGARFRWINEMLYKSDSQHAHEMMRDDPNVFSEYHTGFRHQVQSWPSNPVGHYISVLSKYPARTIVADLGCGDAALARALVPKGLNVLSFDLVSDGNLVIEADTCAKIPLPGTEEDSEDNGHIVDVVVCALSLMGTNWPICIREAWRILREGGELKIAEVASRFTNIDAFVSLVVSIGFKLRSKDDSNTHFTLFEFVKVERKPKSEKEWSTILEQGRLLKPCEYKRR